MNARNVQVNGFWVRLENIQRVRCGGYRFWVAVLHQAQWYPTWVAWRGGHFTEAIRSDNTFYFNMGADDRGVTQRQNAESAARWFSLQD